MNLLSLATIAFAAFWVGATLHLLRRTADRDCGPWAEALAIGLPLLFAWGFVALTPHLLAEPHDSNLRMEPMVELVFLSLPAFLVYRLIERLWKGGQLRIADLFRLTTASAVALFILRSSRASFFFMDILLVIAIYIFGERAATTKNQNRNLAISFSLGLLASIFLAIIFRQPMAFFRFQDLMAVRPALGPLDLLVFPALLVTTPLWMRWLIQQASPLRRLELVLASRQLAAVEPSRAIGRQPMLNLWHFTSGVCYLNHGSFGAVPLLLRQAQQQLRAECEEEPLDFLVRQLEPRWFDARLQLASWIGTQAENIAFCENATAGMNEIAHWFPLATGDEVLINDHEYGAVKRIWQRKCQQAGAGLVTATLPWPLVEPQQIIDAILGSVTERTKLVILSHITSPTAIILPVQRLCALLKERNIPTCIDGPHALLQQPLKLHSLECDFYTASCHKWLCAPLGSGFVYASPRWHRRIVSPRLSWGRLQPAQPSVWSDELLWTGTRDYSAYLSVPQAIRFFQNFDISRLNARNHALACHAREQLLLLTGTEPVTPSGREWFGWMVAVWLPAGDHATLQQRLWRNHRIEVPIVRFSDRWLVRVSCHLYNTTADITRLVHALGKEL